jgi:hypothetical protein
MYYPPFLETKDGVAIRAIQDVIASRDHPFAKHPEDFSLHRLGVFDDASGDMENCDVEKLQELNNLIGE